MLLVFNYGSYSAVLVAQVVLVLFVVLVGLVDLN